MACFKAPDGVTDLTEYLFWMVGGYQGLSWKEFKKLIYEGEIS